MTFRGTPSRGAQPETRRQIDIFCRTGLSLPVPPQLEMEKADAGPAMEPY